MVGLTTQQDQECPILVARREELEFEAMQPPMPAHLLARWRAGAAAFARFQDEFHHSDGALSAVAKAALEEAAEQLKPLAGYTLGDAREFLLLGRLQDVFVPLARDTAYCAEAASWCLQRALNPLATGSYAKDEAFESTRWNSGVSAAIGYYRRAGDADRAAATLDVARKHPAAATRYDRVEQTPLVYFPGLTARPWWPAIDFAIVRHLEAALAQPAQRAAVDAELDALIGRAGLQAVVSPAAPMRAPPGSGDGDWAGGSWSELPLYDGREWDEAACAGLPTLCGLVRGDQGICTAPAAAGAPNLCGTSIVVTILRLAPGADILPHCGTTNRRLTMQLALRGSDGVAFTVGGETRGYGGDGRALVFDDSWEHHVQHRGAEERFVLYAVLKHPDVGAEEYG